MTPVLPVPDRPLNIAHRGASRVAPQNTLAAFEKALQIGADGIEFDVRLCADGVPVVIHDATVDATTDGTGRVEAMGLAALKQLDAGSSFAPAFAGTPIPTLAEVLEAVEGDVLLNVELKAPDLRDRGLEQAVVDVIEQHGMEEQVLLSSFNPLALRRVQQIDPHLATGLLYTRPAWAARGLASLMMVQPLAALHPHRAIVDEQHIGWAKAHRVRLHVWTVDDPSEMRRLIDMGVNGIITNRPDVLRRILDAAT